MKPVYQDLKVIGKSMYLNLYEVTYRNKNNNLKSWMVASRKKKNLLESIYKSEKEPFPDAVIVKAIHEPSGKLVLIRQFRAPVNDYVYELPAGLLENDESIIACLKRELKEETGLTLSEIKEISPLLYATAGMSDESFKMVACTCVGSVSQEFLEEDEDIEVFLLDKEGVKDLMNQNPSMDMKAYHACKQYIHSQ
jgi:ADP-ribose pyrophosphatase